VIGASGGADSSYLLHLANKHDLIPLVVTMDDGWDTTVAGNNVKTMTDELGFKLKTMRLNRPEINDIYRAFVLAESPNLDAPTDVAMMTTLYRAAEEAGTKYILDAHDFRSEATMPPEWAYFDGRYVADVHKKFGRLPMNTYPNLWLLDFMRYTWQNYQRPRLIYHDSLTSKERKEILTKEYGWEEYPGKHHENTWTVFSNFVWNPIKFGIDYNVVFDSARIRSGQLERPEKYVINEPIKGEYLDSVIETTRRKLDMSKLALSRYIVMSRDITRQKKIKTYKPIFKLTAPFWWAAMKTGRVPKSFYDKYCKWVL